MQTTAKQPASRRNFGHMREHRTMRRYVSSAKLSSELMVNSSSAPARGREMRRFGRVLNATEAISLPVFRRVIKK